MILMGEVLTAMNLRLVESDYELSGIFSNSAMIGFKDFRFSQGGYVVDVVSSSETRLASALCPTRPSYSAIWKARAGALLKFWRCFAGCVEIGVQVIAGFGSGEILMRLDGDGAFAGRNANAPCPE